MVSMPDDKVASVPVMITQRMRWTLRKIGYPDSSIRHLTPQDAWELIEEARDKSILGRFFIWAARAFGCRWPTDIDP